ncbi:MAG: oligosaccharide flippase family protein [Clostridia bacterium]|nr:oligosaccharide flippase family protein [Clostridia bacterium]
MKKTAFHKNTMWKNVFILGLSGIIAKLFDFCFRAYYSRMLGTEGMGLLSLGFSLHGVMLTFATAGLGVAVSKTVSEYMEQRNSGAVKACMRTSLYGVSALSLLVMLITFLFSSSLAENVLGDIRVSASLCALAPSIMFMGISYCLKGFFYASRKVVSPALSEILEQTVKFISIKFLLDILLPFGIEYGCVAVFGGISIGELSSCLFLTLIYHKKEKQLEKTDNSCKKITQKELVCKLLGVSIPSMITSLCCSGLRMQEEVLIVSALERGGMAHSGAISSLGVLKGMAMPLLVMPLNLLGSVLSLLVPEVSRASIRSRDSLRRAVLKTYKIGMPIGVAVGTLFLFFGGEITKLVYGSYDAARLVVLLAPLCPVMFADSLSSSVLNGLGKQLRMLFFTLADFCLRFTLIYFTLPKGQTTAFAIMVVASNLFTCLLSTGSVVHKIMPQRSLNSPRYKLTKEIKCGILK